MKNVVNPLFFGQFELISLFVYWVLYSKRTEQLGFQLAIPLSFEILAIQPDLVSWGIALVLVPFIINLLLKFLGVVEILLTNGYEVLELKR